MIEQSNNAFDCHENVMRRWPFRIHHTLTRKSFRFTNKILTNFPVANHIVFGIHLNHFQFFHKNHHNRNHGRHPVWMNFIFLFSFCLNLNMRLESDWMACLTLYENWIIIFFFKFFFSSSLDAIIIIWLEFIAIFEFVSKNDWIDYVPFGGRLNYIFNESKWNENCAFLICTLENFKSKCSQNENISFCYCMYICDSQTMNDM